MSELFDVDNPDHIEEDELSRLLDQQIARADFERMRRMEGECD